MKQKLIIALLLFISFYPLIKAQQRVLTLEETINLAIENNRDVIIAKLNVEKASAAVDEAFGYALPKVDFSGYYNRFISKPKTPFPDFEAMLTNATYALLFDENVIPRDDNKYLPMTNKLQSFAQTHNWEAKVEVTQILFSSAVFRGIGASKIYLDLAKEQLYSTASTLTMNVKKAFYGVLLSQKMLEIVEASLKNAEENLANVKSMQKQGFASDFEAMQVEVQVENIRPQVNEIKNNLKNAQNGLKLLLGLQQDMDIDVTGEFEYDKTYLPDEETTIEWALRSNYDLRTMDLKMQVDDEFIALDRAEYYPTLAAFGNYTYSGTGDEFPTQNYSSTAVGLSLSINLFSGLQTNKRVEQSVIALNQTKEQIKQFKDYLTTQVKGKLLELQKVNSQYTAQERNVELAQKAYDLATVRFKESSGTQLEIKNADIELRTAKTNKIKTIYDFIIAKAELEQLTGKLDDFVKNKFDNIAAKF
ncbi:MAG TPA: TolC family protein [Melioribacteraceae bacterium]|nr:TolC family protein [Melioribacteraceae bacterium]